MLQHALRFKQNAKKTHLDGSDQWFARSRRDEVAFHAHQETGLRASFVRLRHVDVHLVAIEIGIVRSADAFVQPERDSRLPEGSIAVRLAAPEGHSGQNPHSVAHYGHLVQRRLPIEEHDVAVVDMPLHNIAEFQPFSTRVTIAVPEAADFTGFGRGEETKEALTSAAASLQFGGR